MPFRCALFGLILLAGHDVHANQEADDLKKTLIAPRDARSEYQKQLTGWPQGDGIISFGEFAPGNPATVTLSDDAQGLALEEAKEISTELVPDAAILSDFVTVASFGLDAGGEPDSRSQMARWLTVRLLSEGFPQLARLTTSIDGQTIKSAEFGIPVEAWPASLKRSLFWVQSHAAAQGRGRFPAPPKGLTTRFFRPIIGEPPGNAKPRLGHSTQISVGRVVCEGDVVQRELQVTRGDTYVAGERHFARQPDRRYAKASHRRTRKRLWSVPPYPITIRRCRNALFATEGPPAGGQRELDALLETSCAAKHRRDRI